MKVKYVGDDKAVALADGKQVKLTKGMNMECMEREFYSSAFIHATVDSGARVKVKRSELQKA